MSTPCRVPSYGVGAGVGVGWRGGARLELEVQVERAVEAAGAARAAPVCLERILGGSESRTVAREAEKVGGVQVDRGTVGLCGRPSCRLERQRLRLQVCERLGQPRRLGDALHAGRLQVLAPGLSAPLDLRGSNACDVACNDRRHAS